MNNALAEGVVGIEQMGGLLVERKSIRSRDTKASRCSKRASAEVWGLVERTERKEKARKKKKAKP